MAAISAYLIQLYKTVQGFYFRSDFIRSPGCGLKLPKGLSSLIQTLRSPRRWGALDAQQEHSFWFNIHQKGIGFAHIQLLYKPNQSTHVWGQLEEFTIYLQYCIKAKCDVDAAIDPHNRLQQMSSDVLYDLLVFKSGELVWNH